MPKYVNDPALLAQLNGKLYVSDPALLAQLDKPAPNPTDGMSTFERVASGVGSAITDLALGAKQRLDEGASYLERKFEPKTISGIVTSKQKPSSVIGRVGEMLGMPTAADAAARTQATVNEKREIDAPLLQTTGGKIGAIAGKAIPAIGAAFIPGGQTLAGSVLTGAGLGFVEPTGEGESVGRNMLAGGVGGAAGYGVGKAVGYGANKLMERSAQNAAKNAAQDAVAANAKDAGYVIPPSQTNPSIVNKALEGLSGKISTAQSASIKNQKVTNEMAAKALGLPEDAQITKDVLANIRSQAGQAYNAVKGVGTIQADPQYAAALGNITQKFQGASKDFPELAKNEVQDIVASVNKPSFGADSAVDAIQILRDKASGAYAKGDKMLGKAYREASDAMEGLIERNLQAAGQPAQSLLDSFRNARQMIAKTYSVESALNNSTSNVLANKLAAQLGKGRPLSGELKQIGQFGQSFPKAAQEVTSSMPGVSPLDFFGAGGLSAATGNPLAMLTVAARPIARSVILSKPYQNALATPSYGGNSLLNLLATQPGRLGLQVGGETLPQLSK